MGYVFPTLIAMGFGYAITEASLEKALIGRRWAWAGFFLVAVGAVVAMIPVSLGLASVLYKSVAELKGAIMQFLENHNAAPKPFVWTKSASQILEKVARAKQALESQH